MSASDIKAVNAMTAYNKAANIISPDSSFLGNAMGGNEIVGPDFSEMLAQSLSSVADSTQKAETHTINQLSGKSNLDDVAMSLTNAELSIKTLLGVRDRVISAYQDIIKMAI